MCQPELVNVDVRQTEQDPEDDRGASKELQHLSNPLGHLPLLRVIDFDPRYVRTFLPSGKDMSELKLNGLSFMASIRLGRELGPCYMIVNAEGMCRGVFGATLQGAIWGHFSDLTRSETLWGIRNIRRWVRQLLRETGLTTLNNRVWMEHAKAIKWLGKSGCFRFLTVGTIAYPWIEFETTEQVEALDV